LFRPQLHVLPDNADKETFLAEVLEELVEEPEFAKPLERNGLCIRHGSSASSSGRISETQTALRQIEAQSAN